MSHNARRSRARGTRSPSSTFSPGGSPPEPGGHRHARLEHVLLEELTSLLRDEASDPRLGSVRPVSVHLSPDGGNARVAYAVVGDLGRERAVRQDADAALARATGFLRARLAAQLDLKRHPKLAFTFVGVVSADAGRPGGEP